MMNGYNLLALADDVTPADVRDHLMFMCVIDLFQLASVVAVFSTFIVNSNKDVEMSMTDELKAVVTAACAVMGHASNALKILADTNVDAALVHGLAVQLGSSVDDLKKTLDLIPLAPPATAPAAPAAAPAPALTSAAMQPETGAAPAAQAEPGAQPSSVIEPPPTKHLIDPPAAQSEPQS